MQKNKHGIHIVNADSNVIPERLGVSEDRLAILEYKIRKVVKKHLLEDEDNQFGVSEALVEATDKCDNLNEVALTAYYIGRYIQSAHCNKCSIGKGEIPPEVVEILKKIAGEGVLSGEMIVKIKGKKDQNPNLN